MWDNYDTTLIFIYVINIAASFIQGFTSYGDGIIMQVLWQVGVKAAPDVLHDTLLGDNDVALITILTSIRFATIHFMMAWQHRQYFSRKLFLNVAPFHIIGSVVGVWVLVWADSYRTLVKYLLGTFFLSFAAWYACLMIYRWHKFQQRLKALGTSNVSMTAPEFHYTTCLKYSGVVAGFFSGFFQSFSGIGAPPLMVLNLMFHIPGTMVRGTFTVGTVVAAIARIIVMASKGLYDARLIHAYLITIAGGVIGLLLAEPLAGKLSHSTYKVFVVCLMSVASLAMLPIGLTLLLIVGCVEIGIVLCHGYMDARREHAKRAQAAAEAKEQQVHPDCIEDTPDEIDETELVAVE